MLYLCRNELITDAEYSFGDQLLNGDAGERTVLVKQQPAAVNLFLTAVVSITQLQTWA